MGLDLVVRYSCDVAAGVLELLNFLSTEKTEEKKKKKKTPKIETVLVPLFSPTRGETFHRAATCPCAARVPCLHQACGHGSGKEGTGADDSFRSKKVVRVSMFGFSPAERREVFGGADVWEGRHWEYHHTSPEFREANPLDIHCQVWYLIAFFFFCSVSGLQAFPTGCLRTVSLQAGRIQKHAILVSDRPLHTDYINSVTCSAPTLKRPLLIPGKRRP